MPNIGDIVFLNDAGKDLTRYWTNPRDPQKDPEFKRRGWAGKGLEVRQIGAAESGKKFYRLHRVSAREDASGAIRRKTTAVVLAGEEHIAQ